jgi:putative flippase GtrA
MSNIINAHLLKFAATGLSGMLIDFSITLLCKEKLKLDKFVSSSAGFCSAVINNFLLNRYWTFEQSHHPLATQFAIFLLVSITGLVINNFFLYFLLKYLKTNFYLVKLFVTGLVFFWNYAINFLFTFN